MGFLQQAKLKDIHTDTTASNQETGAGDRVAATQQPTKVRSSTQRRPAGFSPAATEGREKGTGSFKMIKKNC